MGDEEGEAEDIFDEGGDGNFLPLLSVVAPPSVGGFSSLSDIS